MHNLVQSTFKLLGIFVRYICKVHLLSTFVKYVRIWQNAYFRNTLGHAEELQYNRVVSRRIIETNRHGIFTRDMEAIHIFHIPRLFRPVEV